MVQSCGSNDFVVSANNDACGSRPGISCVKGVRIKVADSTPGEIYIRQGNHLTINGVLQGSYVDSVEITNYSGLVNDDPSTATALSCPGGLVNKWNAEFFPPCDNSASTVAEVQERCGAIRKSVFSACNAVLDPTTFIEDFEFDYCCSEAAERETFICDALSGYASVCADNGVQPSNWRAEYCHKL